MLDRGFIKQIVVAGRFAYRRIENVFFDLRVDREREADIPSQFRFFCIAPRSFIFAEQGFHLAMILLQQRDRARPFALRRPPPEGLSRCGCRVLAAVSCFVDGILNPSQRIDPPGQEYACHSSVDCRADNAEFPDNGGFSGRLRGEAGSACENAQPADAKPLAGRHAARDLVAGELLYYAADDDSRYTIEGDDISFESHRAVAIGMMFHELATNAAKYGALLGSVGSGRGIVGRGPRRATHLAPSMG